MRWIQNLNQQYLKTKTRMNFPDNNNNYYQQQQQQPYANNNAYGGNQYPGGMNYQNNQQQLHNNFDNGRLQPPASTLGRQPRLDDDFMLNSSLNQGIGGGYQGANQSLNNPNQYSAGGNQGYQSNQGYGMQRNNDLGRGEGWGNTPGATAGGNYYDQNRNTGYNGGFNQPDLGRGGSALGMGPPIQDQRFNGGANNNQNDFQQYNDIMNRISIFTSQSNHRNLDTFFYPFDCHQTRELLSWEFPLIFPELRQGEENVILRVLQSDLRPGSVDFPTFVKELETKFNRGLTLKRMLPKTIYEDKLRNATRIPLSKIEQIARAILDSDRSGSYKSAFESVLFSKNSMTIEDFQQVVQKARMNSSGVSFNVQPNASFDRLEVESVFNYLCINDMNYVSKIQFVQGLRFVIPEAGSSQRRPEGVGAGRNFQGVGDQNNLTMEQVRYLSQIQSHIQQFSLDLTRVLQEAGVPFGETHISKFQLDELGKCARVRTQLNENQLTDLIIKLEDPIRRDFVPIRTIEAKLLEYGRKRAEGLEDMGGPGVLDDSSLLMSKAPKQERETKHILDLISEYLQLQFPKPLHELIPNVMSEGDLKFVSGQSFFDFLTKTLVNALQDAPSHGAKGKVEIDKFEAEKFIAFFQTKLDRVNLTMILEEIEKQQPLKELTQKEAKKHIEVIFDQIKRFITRNEVNLVEVLFDSDEDDGYLDKEELREALPKLGVQKLTIEQLSAVFALLDPNRTQRVVPQQLIDKFYEYANAKRIPEGHKMFAIYEKVRKYIIQKKYLSISRIFFDENFLRAGSQDRIDIETSEFINTLKQMVGVTELSSMMTEQLFVAQLLSADGRVDFQKFADQVGFEKAEKRDRALMGGVHGQGKGVQKFINRRLFYRTILRSITTRQSDQKTIFSEQKDKLERDLRESDATLQGIIPLKSFKNVINRYCSQIPSDLIDLVARDFQKNQAQFQGQVFYLEFLKKVQEEFSKLALINKVFRSFFETLAFKAESSLYSLFQQEKINKEELYQILAKRGVTVDDQETNMLMEEYDPEQVGYVKFHDVERDYQELTEDLRARGGFSQIVNLPQVLQAIKRYLDMKGQTLRELFNKTKLQADDQINQYQFTRQMNSIAQETKTNIPETSIHKLILEITVIEFKNDKPKGGEQLGFTKFVSFTLLNQLFNKYFNLQEKEDLAFGHLQIDRVQWQIAQIATERKITGFRLDQHFDYPSSAAERFREALKKEPLNLDRSNTQQNLDDLVKRYQDRGVVNTQLFIIDLNEKMIKHEHKMQIFNEVRKQIVLKSLKIEQAFFKAIPEIEKFQIHNLTAEEFSQVFLFLEVKVTLESVSEFLRNFFQPDKHGKYSYLEFIEEFNRSEKESNIKKGKRNFPNLNEILKHVATQIQTRNLKAFGSLLADNDLKQQNQIEKEVFYRVMDSLQMNLGEQDIQELIRVYRKTNSPNFIDILRFRDDLNSLITSDLCKVQLKSVLNSLVNERIVEHIDMSPKSSKKKLQLEQEALTLYMPLVLDLMCGLLVRNQEVTEWFSRFGATVKGSLVPKEFQTALDSLDLRILDPSFSTNYFNHLLKRQEVYLGYQSQILLVEQLQQILAKDCAMTKSQLQEAILLEIATQLANQMTPVLDQILILDNAKSGFVHRSDFSGMLLDNYLSLGNLLTENKKRLLTQRYAPTESSLNIEYRYFLEDLKRIEQSQQGKIKLCFTGVQVMKQQQNTKDQARKELEQADFDKRASEQQRQPDAPARSNKNTVALMRDLANLNQLYVQNIPNFQFEDIMLETFKRGVSVEACFKKFSHPEQGDLILEKKDFKQAMGTLGLKWAEDLRVSDMFDAMDLALHGNYRRALRIQDIDQLVLVNAKKTVDDFQAIVIEQVFEGLKQQNMLSKLRDLFVYYNSRRDYTCSMKEMSAILIDQLKLPLTESQLLVLLPRYKSDYDASRMDFTQFIRDMEYCSQGIKASLIWAMELAEDIVKGVIVKGLKSPEELFHKFEGIKGIIQYPEFRQAMQDIQIDLNYEDEEFSNFFNHVAQDDAASAGPRNEYNRVGVVQLCNNLKRLCQKSLAQLYQQILEKIFGESKKQNLSITVYTIFSSMDPEKTQLVNFADFMFAFKNKLGVRTLKEVDYKLLAKRYRTNRIGLNIDQDMIEYEKFFADYAKIEKYGLKAGVDSLKKQQQEAVEMKRPQEVSEESKQIYSKMAGFCQKQNIVDLVCEELVRQDQGRTGMLASSTIQLAFKTSKMPLNNRQMSFILEPLAFDAILQSYNYLMMIDMLFGRPQMQKIQQKYELQGFTTSFTQGPSQPAQTKGQPSIAESNLVMGVRFKDSLELRYQNIANIVYSVSKGNYLLRDSEFLQVFKRAGMNLTSTDMDFLGRSFQLLRNPSSQTIDFRRFCQHFGVSDVVSQLLVDLQTQIQTKNVLVDALLCPPAYSDFLAFEDYKNLVENTLMLEVKKFTPTEQRNLFDALAERKDKIERSVLARALKGESALHSASSDSVPYIVTELTYFICNNNLDIFKFFNPDTKKLTLQQFQQLLQSLKFVPNNPKELPQLPLYLNVDGESNVVSVEKLLAMIRKIIPTYAQQYQKKNPQMNRSGQAEAVQVSKQLSMFNNKVKQVLSKINEHLKKNGITTQQLLLSMDKNKNGLVERSEFVTYFSQDQQIKGLSLSELELLYDALDMNKDGVLSVNEICLCLEGTQQTLKDKMSGFDLDLQKEMEKQIDQLFAFFDSNQDGQISVEELVIAFRSFNQAISINEAREVMKAADRDGSKGIDKQEFRAIMLPKFKEEMLGFEQNMDELRRLFKECDADQSNYLSKAELKNALLKLNLELTDVQLGELMKEMDVDANENLDIDEFIAFLSIADQIKFKNPQTKTNIMRIRYARKLHAVDFYNCFKNLPTCFLPSFTTDQFEKRGLFTPSHGLYPEYDSKLMAFKDLQKLEQLAKQNTLTSQKQFAQIFEPQLSCEIQLEEMTGVPLPKKEEFDWAKITHREVRALLYDNKSGEYLSNSFIVQAQARPESEGKWLFNSNENLNQAKNFILRVDLPKYDKVPRDVHLLFELVYYTLQNSDSLQQVTCAWASIPIAQLDKAAKHRVTLRGGNPQSEVKIEQSELHQEKKGFTFLKKLAASGEDSQMALTVKPFAKFSEQSQVFACMLPSNCLVSKRLLSFAAAFRLYCLKKLMKYQQTMTAPQGNFVIAQFRKIFDNPDVNFVLGDCWELEMAPKLLPQSGANKDAGIDMSLLMKKMEEFMIKVYSIIYSSEFQFDHVYPTRSTPIDSDLFRNRELLVKNALIPGNRVKPTIDPSKKKKEAGKENLQANAQVNVQESLNNIFSDEYKPFNISEMEITMSGVSTMESKQDELLKMYKEMGLIY